MSLYEPELYYELKKLGIDPRILELFPIQPLKIKQILPEAYIWESEEGDYAFWLHHGQEADLAIRHQILRICESRGFSGFIYPLIMKDGRTYARLDERRWFYLTRWPEWRRLFFSDFRDLRSMVSLIAGFRNVINSSGPLFCLPGRAESNNLFMKFQAVIESFCSFTLLAKYRLRPSQFDRLFSVYVLEATKQIKYALGLLEKFKYHSLLGKLTTKDIIINRLVRSNLRIAYGGMAVCLRFNDYQWDLPIIDLAILMIKTGRASKWSRTWFETIVSEYQKQFSITPEEWGVIYAFLMFPWSFYRLSSRYYYNRVEWSLGSLISRMERILEDEENRLEFLKNLWNL